MDLLSAGIRDGLFKIETKPTSLGRTVFLSPMMNVVPEDGIMRYVTIESASDYCAVENGSVVMFREDQADWLATVVERADFFDIGVIVLHGVPGLEYSDWFDAKTATLPKTAYSAYISEIRMAEEVALQSKAEHETRYDRERNQRTRTDGSVRYGDFSAFDESEEDEI